MAEEKTKPFATLKEAATRPQVIEYITACLKCSESGATFSKEDVEDILQDILIKIHLSPKDRPLDSECDKWKGYLSTLVKNHLIDRGKKAPEIKTVPDEQYGEDGSTFLLSDYVSEECYNDDVDTYDDNSEDDDTWVLAVLFEAVWDICAPVEVVLGTSHAPVLPLEEILDDNTGLHLTTSQKAKWLAIWKLEQVWPRLANAEIARRVGCDDMTVAKAIAARQAEGIKFYERAAEQWQALDDHGKADWLKRVMSSYLRQMALEIAEEQRRSDWLKYHSYLQPTWPLPNRRVTFSGVAHVPITFQSWVGIGPAPLSLPVVQA